MSAIPSITPAQARRLQIARPAAKAAYSRVRSGRAFLPPAAREQGDQSPAHGEECRGNWHDGELHMEFTGLASALEQVVARESHILSEQAVFPAWRQNPAQFHTRQHHGRIHEILAAEVVQCEAVFV